MLTNDVKAETRLQKFLAQNNFDFCSIPNDSVIKENLQSAAPSSIKDIQANNQEVEDIIRRRLIDLDKKEHDSHRFNHTAKALFTKINNKFKIVRKNIKYFSQYDEKESVRDIFDKFLELKSSMVAYIAELTGKSGKISCDDYLVILIYTLGLMSSSDAIIFKHKINKLIAHSHTFLLKNNPILIDGHYGHYDIFINFYTINDDCKEQQCKNDTMFMNGVLKSIFDLTKLYIHHASIIKL